MNRSKNRQGTSGHNADGTIRWSYLSPLDVNPGAEGVLDALEALVSKREVVA
jgi:hypothetical protein